MILRHCREMYFGRIGRCEKNGGYIAIMQEINNTQYFKVQKEQEFEVKDVIAKIYEALTEKGYNPVNQIVGYVMSGDPTYITSHNGARSLIMRVERDEIIEVLLEDYIQNNFK